MSRQIRVVGGSVQFLLVIIGQTFCVDIWNMSGRWKWTARREKSRGHLAQGETARWSEARTAAFRACVKSCAAAIPS